MIIDSQMSEKDALAQNPDMLCPQYIIDELQLVTTYYLGFDGKDHCGQIIVHNTLARDVIALFTNLYAAKFPLGTMIPISAPQFRWDDALSMCANNCHGFNYRFIAGTNRLSYHATGHAIDLNPRQNPMIKDGESFPSRAQHLPGMPGVFRCRDIGVTLMKALGWEWGGDWTSFKDYHHFQKIKF